MRHDHDIPRINGHPSTYSPPEQVKNFGIMGVFKDNPITELEYFSIVSYFFEQNDKWGMLCPTQVLSARSIS